ncbi:MAG: Cupredoxin-like domain, partial [Candidatus Parcubacteria bacterium]
GTCQSNNTQSRTVNSSSPTGCTGGTPVTTQACTYTPPTGTPQTYTVSVLSGGGFSPASLTIAAGDSIRFNWTSGDEINVSFSPGTIQSFKLDHEKKSFTRTFSSAGTWTFSANGKSGTVTVN